MSESKKQELRILKRKVSFQIVLILKKKLFFTLLLQKDGFYWRRNKIPK